MQQYLGMLFITLLCCPSALPGQRAWWAGLSGEIAETSGLTGWAYGVAGGLAWERYYGGGFVTQTTTLLEGEVSGSPYRVYLQFGGLSGAYHRPAIGALEVTMGFRVGVGRAIRTWKNSSPPLPTERDAVYVAIPFAGLEMPLTQGVRISLCSGYRFFGGFGGIESWTDRDLMALANTLSIRVHFGRR